jgi:hypothetical protein
MDGREREREGTVGGRRRWLINAGSGGGAHEVGEATEGGRRGRRNARLRRGRWSLCLWACGGGGGGDRRRKTHMASTRGLLTICRSNRVICNSNLD